MQYTRFGEKIKSIIWISAKEESVIEDSVIKESFTEL